MELANSSNFREPLSMTERPSMNFRVFGLTGGVASGKSTVAGRVRELGIEVVDADDVARAVVEPGTPGLEEILARFGQVLSADGCLDRKKLGRIVFADDDARGRLEAIVHPKIAVETGRRFAALAARGDRLACYDAALLVERGLQDSFRPLVVVSLPRPLQRARLIEREGLDSLDADRRIDAQWSLERKLAVADFVIDNRGTVVELLREVDRVVLAIRAAEPLG